MVRYYVARINAGWLTLEEVPVKWQEKVKEILEGEQ